MDYDKKYFDNVPASRLAEALRTEGIPVSSRARRYSNGCHKEGMLEEHINSQAFRKSFSKARLKKIQRIFTVADNR